MNLSQKFVCSKGFARVALTLIIFIATISAVKMFPELTEYINLTNVIIVGVAIFIGIYIGGGVIMKPEELQPRRSRKSKDSSKKEGSKTNSIFLPGRDQQRQPQNQNQPRPNQ